MGRVRTGLVGDGLVGDGSIKDRLVGNGSFAKKVATDLPSFNLFCFVL
jgi:hypothetical protein